MTEAHAPSGDTGELTHKQIMTILVGLLSGMFLGALDQTIVSTSIRTIADELNGLSVQAWVTTAYLITSTIATPIYGKLGDLYGRKKLFMFAITVFVIGSAMCAFATSMYMLAAFRAVQGIGAGGLFTLVLAIVGDIVSPRERAKYTGYFMAVFGTSSVLGPVIGGLFAAQSSILGVTGWRWVFLVNVPIGVVALALVLRTLHLEHHRREARIDWSGAAMLVVALVPLLTVAEQGREWGWDSGRSLLCFVVGGLGVLGFVAAETLMGDDALIPISLFRLRVASVTIAASVIVGMAMFGGMMILPLYMQIVHEASPMESGFLMLPMVAGMMSASITTGQITSRTGHIRMFPRIGTALVAAGLVLLSLVGADTSLVLVMACMLLLGAGLGCCMQPLTLIVQNAVPPREIGVATSAAAFFRQIGGTVGVAVFLSVLFSTVGGNISSAFRDAATTPAFQAAVADPSTPVDRQVAEAVSGGSTAIFTQVTDDSSVLGRMSAVFSHPFKVGFADSMSMVFLYAGLLAVVAFVILLFMPKVHLRASSGRVAAQAEAQSPGAVTPTT